MIAVSVMLTILIIIFITLLVALWRGSQNSSDEAFAYCASAFLALLMHLCVTTLYDFHTIEETIKVAVEQGYGKYDPKTGEFVWNDPNMNKLIKLIEEE